jgi:hypothetical protein
VLLPAFSFGPLVCFVHLSSLLCLLSDFLQLPGSVLNPISVLGLVFLSVPTPGLSPALDFL